MKDEHKKTDDRATLESREDRNPEEELTDRMSEALRASGQAAGSEPETSAEDTALEEEQVKDEIDIQIDLLKDEDWAVRREAVVTLGEMGDERCVEPVVRALRDGDWQVREAAIEACGMIGSPCAEPLIKLLRDWDVRRTIISALGKIKDERVLDPLIHQLRSDEFYEIATEALAELGKPAVPKLIEALKDRDQITRKQAVSALGRIGDPEAVDALIGMLKNPDWEIRLYAAAALEKIGDERGREAIKPLMQDPDLVVKMRVERILSAWKKKKAATA